MLRTDGPLVNNAEAFQKYGVTYLPHCFGGDVEAAEKAARSYINKKLGDVG